MRRCARSEPGALSAKDSGTPRRVVPISSAGPPKRQSVRVPWLTPVTGEQRVTAASSTRSRRGFITSSDTLPGMSPSGA